MVYIHSLLNSATDEEIAGPEGGGDRHQNVIILNATVVQYCFVDHQFIGFCGSPLSTNFKSPQT